MGRSLADGAFSLRDRRFRQGVLLAGEAGDKASAADFSARLKPAVDPQQVAPWRQPGGLLRQKAPEHDAVSAQQRPCHMLDRVALFSIRPAWDRERLAHFLCRVE